MAVRKENSLSLEHLTDPERNTFTKQREHRLKMSINRPLLLQPDFSTPQSSKAQGKASATALAGAEGERAYSPSKQQADAAAV
ncbi:hypothetical protein VZT92_023477 [Zoarces viviparus]|uniref:Uncharacterized protein n=1 Tax=Zoarces viviparus TaxID=48416 RepID=A0AAW1E6C4_ZOAVI